jgi:hypothetical protein
MNYEDFNKVYEVERIMEYHKWCGEIPHIKFPSDWEVQIIPPFAGAVVRFKIRKDDASVSIYLDCYDRLGCYGEPYWEVYPYHGDTYRCDMADTNSLLRAIAESIEEQSI